MKIAIIFSTFWEEISEKILNSCLKTLKEKGISEKKIEIFKVPGALEIPLLAKKLAKKRKYKAIIAIGTVIKGKTFHFKQVAIESVKGCQRVSYEYEIPVIFEVLSVYDKKDALKRAMQKGKEGALTVLKMIEILKAL
ncbi:MAG: 6,7-dimethyl-8-ribityllumazine synthase [Patescibacteria group bacterium]|nr:6,7-dimethyl-8-ribityllumazine synthase [Patescibacteria group bacterium]